MDLDCSCRQHLPSALSPPQPSVLRRSASCPESILPLDPMTQTKTQLGPRGTVQRASSVPIRSFAEFTAQPTSFLQAWPISCISHVRYADDSTDLAYSVSAITRLARRGAVENFVHLRPVDKGVE